MRALAIVLAAVMLLGYGWFAPHQTTTSYIGLVGGAMLLLAMALLPRRTLKSAFARLAFLVIGVTGVGTQVPMIWKDYLLINGADYPAIILRLLICFVFLRMATIELKGKAS